MSDSSETRKILSELLKETEQRLTEHVTKEVNKTKEDVGNRLSAVKQEITTLKETARNKDSSEKKKNIIVHGIEEDVNEKWSDIKTKISELVEKLGTTIDYDLYNMQSHCVFEYH